MDVTPGVWLPIPTGMLAVFACYVISLAVLASVVLLVMTPSPDTSARQASPMATESHGASEMSIDNSPAGTTGGNDEESPDGSDSAARVRCPACRNVYTQRSLFNHILQGRCGVPDRRIRNRQAADEGENQRYWALHHLHVSFGSGISEDSIEQVKCQKIHQPHLRSFLDLSSGILTVVRSSLNVPGWFLHRCQVLQQFLEASRLSSLLKKLPGPIFRHSYCCEKFFECSWKVLTPLSSSPAVPRSFSKRSCTGLETFLSWSLISPILLMSFLAKSATFLKMPPFLRVFLVLLLYISYGFLTA